MLLNANLTLRPRSPRVFCVGAAIVLFTCAALFGAIRLNTADGGVQAAQAELPISGAQPESPAQETKPSAEKEKKTAEGGVVAVKIVRGSVVDQAGKPVAQAKLCLPLGNRPRRVAQATADDAGRFELKIPVTWLDREARGYLSTLWAYAPGYSIGSENVVYRLERVANELTIQIALPPQESTKFKILTPNGEPQRDALVQPYQYKSAFGYEFIPEEFLNIIGTRTDAEGGAAFSALERKHLMGLQIASEAFGDQKVNVDRLPQEDPRIIRLRGTGRIEGRLIGEKPEWVRGVRLSISTENGDERTKPHGTAEVVTDHEGRYVVPAIASGGPVQFYVGIDSKLPVRPRLEGDLTLKEGETMRMDIPLESIRVVYGTLKSKSSEKPIPNVEIILDHGHNQRSRARTNDKGYFEAQVLPGRVWFQLMLPDRYVSLENLPSLPQQVPEGAEKFELAEFIVTDTVDLIGMLVGEKNEPLAGKQVVALCQDRRYGTGKTDLEGRFKLKMPQGLETIFEVELEKAGSQSEPAQVIQKNPLILRYIAGKGWELNDPERAKKADVTLTGRVLSDGKPLPGVRLALMRSSKSIPLPDKSNPKAPPHAFTSRVLQAFETVSDADGRYRLSGLKAGDEYIIHVTAAHPLADFDWIGQSFQHLEDQAKGDITLPDLNLRKWTQTLAGIVVDPAGKPVSGVQVRVSPQNRLTSISRLLKTGPPPWTTTDSAGRFYLEQLPDEPLQIVASIPPEKTQPGKRNLFTLTVDKNQQNIRFVLGP